MCTCVLFLSPSTNVRRLESKIPRTKMSVSPNATLAVDPVTVSTTVFCYFNLFCVSDPTVKEYDIHKNTDFNITCTMDEPITWAYPKYKAGRACNSSTYNITDAKLPDGRYQSTFVRNRACYLDTGFYLCTTSAERHKEGYYIYVNDEEHPIFGVDVSKMIATDELTDVLVPCRPTSSKIKPLLVQQFQEDQIAFEDAKYDPHEGFVLSRVHRDRQGFYRCRTEDKKYALSWFMRIFAMHAEIHDLFIQPVNAYHANVGDNVSLTCFMSVGNLDDVEFVWKYPNENLKPFIIEGMRRKTRRLGSKKYLEAKDITLINLSKSFEGLYTCSVEARMNSKNVTYNLVVHDENSARFLNLSVPDGTSNETVSAGTREFEWIVNVTSYPRANISWSFKGRDIAETANTREYTEDFDGLTAKLGMRNVTIDDGGLYTITADIGQEKSQLSLTLFVKDQPRINGFGLKEPYLVNESSRIVANVSGYPRPIIRWYAKNCSDQPTCNFEELPLESHVENALEDKHSLKSVLTIRSNSHLELRIVAQNDIGNSSALINFHVTDVPDMIEAFATPKIAEVGDEIILTCRACGFFYKGISWSFRGSHSDAFVPAERIAGILIRNTTTSISLGETLRIPNASKNFSGQYRCYADPHSPSHKGFPTRRSITIAVNECTYPNWNLTNMLGGTTRTETLKQLTLECRVNGYPTPQITWLKNEAPLSLPPGDTRVSLRNSNQTLLINYAAWSDEGKYTCIAANKVGVISASQVIHFTDKPKDHSNVYLSIAIVSAIFIVICCALIVRLVSRVRKERALRKELEATGLLNFEEGAVGSLNPELGIEEQTDLLPYDRRWEFPREKLSIGKQLGSGAFGMVMKAEANGIVEEGTTTTVAVKMVKRGADPLHIRALASELKIMVHLGRHLNVVNLLGACTNNIRKIELVVIVEYCRYGNLRNLLLKGRKDFINQVNDRDELDFSITALNEEDQYCNMSYGSHITNSAYTGAPSTASTDVSNLRIRTTPIGADGYLINTDTESDCYSGYGVDYSDAFSHPVRTADLISWSFQISCGMQYLAGRKVLHGDLAARNVLLTDGNIVKICDFGLAKSMYNNDNYQRRRHELLPVRWMAVESIRDRVFSVHSDVWSFGITMWELFSLSVTPYPGVEDFETLYSKLAAGVRLDRPKYASREIYGIMMDCWREEPTQRPTFAELSSRLNALLEENARSHYTNMNTAYLKMNPIKNNDVDYLELLNLHQVHAAPKESTADVPSGGSSYDEDDNVKLRPLRLKTEFTNMNPNGIWVSNPSYAHVAS